MKNKLLVFGMLPVVILLLMAGFVMFVFNGEGLSSEIPNPSENTGPVTPLSVPVGVRLEANNLTWTPVANASGYKVNVDGVEYSVALTYYNIAALGLAPGVYALKVRAAGVGKYGNSEYSDVVSYTASSATLSAPGNLRVEGVLFRWDAVDKAANGYKVKINGSEQYGSIYGTSYTLPVYTFDVGTPASLTVKAIGGGNYIESVYSAPIQHIEYTRNLNFISNGDGYTLINNPENRDSVVAIPPTYEGKPVTKINEEAFKDSPLVTVIIPSSVTDIGNEAFKNCNLLTNITLSANNRLDFIGESAFAGCTLLTEITIPDSVRAIGANAFEGCVNLSSVNLSAEGLLERINDMTFTGCAKLTEITIPDKVQSIGERAFAGCVLLSEIMLEFDSRLVVIGHEAFAQCQNLISIYIPSQVSSISIDAFTGCGLPAYIRVEDSNQHYTVIDGSLCTIGGEVIWDANPLTGFPYPPIP